MLDDLIKNLEQLRDKFGNVNVYLAIGDNAVPLGSLGAYTKDEEIFVILEPVENLI